MRSQIAGDLVIALRRSEIVRLRSRVGGAQAEYGTAETRPAYPYILDLDTVKGVTAERRGRYIGVEFERRQNLDSYPVAVSHEAVSAQYAVILRNRTAAVLNAEPGV